MKYFKKIICVLLVFILAGCGQVKKYTAYTVYPIGYLISRIGGNRISSISIQKGDVLVQKANAIDDFDAIIDDSYFLFHIADLEPYLEVHADKINDSDISMVDLSLLNAMYKFQRYTRVSSGEKETYIESPYYDGEVFNEIDTYDSDLFLWLDPSGMLSLAKDVCDTFSSNYVEQATYFKENYEALYSELTTLEASYHSLSEKLKKENKEIKFVCATPSFGCWQKSYGFSIYPLCLSKYGSLPTEEQYQIIKQRILDDNVKYIAYEPNMTDDMRELCDRIQSELNLTRINLSNISSLTESQKEEGKDYISLMYENYNILENIATNSITQEDND